MDDSTPLNACTEQRYEVRESDLPLSCPMPSMTTWDAHPKVYLDIASKGEIKCPYCGALYILVK